MHRKFFPTTGLTFGLLLLAAGSLEAQRRTPDYEKPRRVREPGEVTPRTVTPNATAPTPTKAAPAPAPKPTATPAPAPTSTPPTGGRAKYRVVLNGFKAHHETWDHALQVDGQRDEIFITKDVTLIDLARDIQLPAAVRSMTHGDMNGFRSDERVQAGNSSAKGGIRNGNGVPIAQPWTRQVAPAADRMPWLIWEGELVEGQNAVAVILTPWEFDGGQDAYGDWVGWAQRTAQALKKSDTFTKLVGEKGKMIFELADLGLGLALSLQEDGILGNAQDRPIGLVQTGTKDGKPIYGSSPKVLTLNLATAELALANDFGFGRGIIPLRYTDAPKFAGDYELYVQIERLP